MNPIHSSDMKVARHFTILVYPFRHALSDQTRLARLQTLEGRWRLWWSRLRGDGQALAVALDDSYFFLPYVRKLLFPETSRLPEADPPQQVAEASALEGRATEHERLGHHDLAAELREQATLIWRKLCRE